MRKSVKKGLAAFLAAVMMMPAQPLMTAMALPPEQAGQDAAETGTMEQELSETETAVQEVPENGTYLASPSNAAAGAGKTAEAGDMVIYNTGNCEVCVVNEEDVELVSDRTLIDVFYADGDYTIYISEPNPFFPYEVQFTYDGKTERRWFMTPEDSVTVGGHTFRVSAYFDGETVTQMSLNVGGDKVIVYPEEKEFTNDGGFMLMSLLPLEERRLTVDLTGYTPAELTMVSVDSIFNGENALADTDKVVWKRTGNDFYRTSTADEYLDLSLYTMNGGTSWEMIVGDDDQLAAENVRYIVRTEVTESENWLIPTVYVQDEEGNLIEVSTTENTGYFDAGLNGRMLRTYVPSAEMKNREGAVLSLQINPEVFSETRFDHFRVYYTESHNTYTQMKDPAYAEGCTDITDQLFGSGVSLWDNFGSNTNYLSMITYDSEGNVTGCLPLRLWLSRLGNYVDSYGIYKEQDGYRTYAAQSSDWDSETEIETIIYTLRYGYPADDRYKLILQYEQAGVDSPSLVTAAYVGRYTSIAEAEAAGAADISSELFDQSQGGGYEADYSSGVSFTVFVGEDGTEGQEVYTYCVRTETGSAILSSGTIVQFTGLRDGDGNYVACYVADDELDSYAEYNYLTILAEPGADLSELAPEFWTMEGVHLYAEGSSSPEISGESFHDFSGGPMQYTASAENGTDSRNYWVHVIQAEEGSGKLYINSLSDADAETREEDGVIYSTREMFLDGRYEYQHDILLVNVGTESITNLSAVVESEQVELDSYWTLSGDYELAGFDAVNTTTSYGELPNLAKLRLQEKAGVESGSEISGTLTIKSGETVLMVLTLTGTVGDPGIVTKEIPEAVKYVPYGTMIQNSNKYSWNMVSYYLSDGELPGGMVLKKNGELYGVPTEAGEFEFTVRMENSYEMFEVSEAAFTLTVIENTDENVDAATDQGYDLTQRVQDITLNSSGDQTMVSQGVYDQFVDIFLDGVKLVEGVDYDSESGSTRITIRSQTLKASNTVGTHTLGVEFRTEDTNTLKRAAQNYRVTAAGGSGGDSGSGDNSGEGGNGSGGSSGSGSSSGSSSGNSSVSVSQITRDAKKGYVHAVTGILTGTESGYSRWVQDENGWKLLYADGTYAAGQRVVQADGTTVEQILWEKVNNSWFAFGADGYLKSGWVYDYQAGSWYGTSVESGMRSGWYTDPQDRYTYYLEPETGKLATGWKNIEGSWYYFNAVIAPPTWEFDENSGSWYYNVKSTTQPYGSLYRGGKTPDGYEVDESGVWKES